MKLNVLKYLLIFSLILVGCKKKDPKPELPELSVVDISQESDWDYWVVGKSDYYFLKTENSLPQTVLFHSSEANKDYSIFFTNDGLPEKVAVDGFIFLFKNFNGTKADVGIINPNGDIEILRELDTGYDWSNLTLKSANSITEWSDVIRWTGRAVGAVPCVLSVVAAVNSAGVLAPWALWSCGNYVLKLSGDIAKNELDIHNGFTDFVDFYSYTTLGDNCTDPDPTSCIARLAAKGLSLAADELEEIENQRAEDVQTTMGALNYGYGDVQITLVWDNDADLDLHVYDPSDEEIWWKNTYSYTGGILDVDDINGYGPENVYWPKGEAPSGSYKVYLRYYVWDNEPWRPYTSNYAILINAFGRVKKYSGSISLGQTIHIQDFDQDGLKSAIVGGNFKISEEKKIK